MKPDPALSREWIGWRIALAAATTLLLAANGCVRLERPFPKIQRYALEAARPADAPARQSTAELVVKLRPMRVGQMFDERKFVYRRSPSNWETDFYHEFFIPPGQMMTALVQSWLARSGVAGQVVPASSQLTPTHVLEGAVSDLYGDWSDPAAPRAVATIEFLLLDERSRAGGAARIVLHRTYRREVPLADSDPRTLIAGWDAALAAILQGLEADLAAVSWMPAPGGTADPRPPTGASTQAGR